jgi:enoyl-CoA hydratase/carnithine racemase
MAETPQSDGLVLVERAGDVVTITLDHPAKRNALSIPMLDALTAALRAAGDSDALGVILAANGPAFSAGHDFGDMGATSRWRRPTPPSRSRVARAACSATRRWSPWPATSDASGRWRWP